MRILLFEIPSHKVHLPAPVFDGSAVAVSAYITVTVKMLLRVAQYSMLVLLFPFVFLGVSVSLLSFFSHPRLTGCPSVTQHSEVLPLPLLGLCQMRHPSSQTAQLNSSGKI